MIRTQSVDEPAAQEVNFSSAPLSLPLPANELAAKAEVVYFSFSSSMWKARGVELGSSLPSCTKFKLIVAE